MSRVLFVYADNSASVIGGAARVAGAAVAMVEVVLALMGVDGDVVVVVMVVREV